MGHRYFDLRNYFSGGIPINWWISRNVCGVVNGNEMDAPSLYLERPISSLPRQVFRATNPTFVIDLLEKR
jgi:hypothetical protein